MKYSNKADKVIKLLTKWLLDKIFLLKEKILVEEPRARTKPQKIILIKITVINKLSVAEQTLPK